jgi:hypothetical protein
MLPVVAFGAEPITFTFNPPTEISYTEQYVRTTRAISPRSRSQRSAETTGTTRIARDGDGYRYTTTVTTCRMLKDGRAAPDAFTDLMLNLPLSLRVSARGAVTGVEGYAAFRERIEAQAPAQVKALMLQAAADDVILAGEQQKWQERIGRFIGKTVEVGQLWLDTTVAAVPNSTMLVVYRATAFAEHTTVQGKSALRIKVLCSNDPAVLARALDKPIEEIIAISKEPLPKTKYPYTSKGELVLDPATMLLVSDISEETAMFDIKTQNGAVVPLTITERKELRYTYQ